MAGMEYADHTQKRNQEDSDIRHIASLCDLALAVKRSAPHVIGRTELKKKKIQIKVTVAFNSLTRCLWKWNSTMGGP